MFPPPPKKWVDCEGMIFFTYSNFLAYQSLPEYKFSENFLVLVKNYEIKSKNYWFYIFSFKIDFTPKFFYMLLTTPKYLENMFSVYMTLI